MSKESRKRRREAEAAELALAEDVTDRERAMLEHLRMALDRAQMLYVQNEELSEIGHEHLQTIADLTSDNKALSDALFEAAMEIKELRGRSVEQQSV